MFRQVQHAMSVPFYSKKDYMIDTFLFLRILNPMVTGPSPVGCITQPTDNTSVTKKANTDTKPENQNLVSGLFSETEFDAELKLIIETWPNLSVELRQAIVKMVK